MSISAKGRVVPGYVIFFTGIMIRRDGETGDIKNIRGPDLPTYRRPVILILVNLGDDLRYT